MTRALLVAALLVTTAAPARAGDGIDVSAGVSALVLVDTFFGALGPAAELSVEGPLWRELRWGAGARLGGGVDGYVRALVAPRLGRWAPAAGLELGLSSRTDLSGDGPLLADMRAQVEDEIAPPYLAVDAAPLRFRIGDRWRLSFAELQVGTHLDHPGRALRLQVGLVAVGRSL